MVRFKKTPRISLHGNIRPHFPRPDIDILLSLKDPVYSSVMFGYFQSMGEKTTTDNTTTDANEDEGEETPESVVAKKALLHFKEDCPYVKFFVKLPRDGIYEEIFEQVDDPEALEIIRCHLDRRMDSANLWLNPAEDGTYVIESNDTKLPDPTLLPSPAEPQQQQIQDKNVNGVVGAALNESNNKSLISPPHPRPNIDIILSLKYPAYGAVMLHYFHLMGNKITDNTANEERGVTSESEMAQKALLHFKRISKSTTVRFFNLLSGNLVDGAFEEVDEEAALRIIRCHLNRRMDYKKQWPDPTLPPSPEPQQQQIQDKNVNGVVGAALNESNNKSLISPPHPRPNIDIILSLEDPVYSSTMLGYFQLMGEKTTGSTTNEQGETLESVVAKKALLYFKRTSTTTTVRFFKLLSRNLVDGKFKLVDEPNALFIINRDLKRRMVWAKLWLNRAEDETAFVDTNDTNTANDAKLPDPILLPSPESQHQQIEQKYDNVSGIATKDSNNNDGHANNDCEKSLISSPYPRPNIDIILSLKDPVYSSTMLGYFQLMGEKTTGSTTNEQGETLESVVAKKALLHFKRTSTLTTVRFFKLLSRNLVDGKFKEADEEAALRKIRCDLNRRMDSAKLWLNNAEDETAIRNTADSNISNDAKLPEPVLPSPEPQQQQIQQNNDDVGSAATKDSNNNNGVANNDSNQSLVSPPHPRPNVDIILSLKDPIYSSVMMECFQMMGNKNDNTASEEDAMKSVVSKKALLHFKGAERDASLTFKDRNTIGETMTVTNTSTVRFFKPESRHKVDRTFVMVDEKAALRKIICDINRRMDSAKLWMNDAKDETVISDAIENNDSKDMKIPELRRSAPETQQQQIQQNVEDVGGAATNDSNNKSLISPHPRPNVDIILSLKDPVYSSVMTKFFQLMGKKNHYNYTEEAGVKDMANEALLTFKNKNRNTIGETDEEGHAPMTATATTTTTTVRFFKPKSRNVLDGKFVEVDEQVALRKIRCDMNRRMDSAHLWMNAEEETPMSDVRDKNITINALPPMVKDGKSKRPRPNIDIILSLKDPVYSSIMMGYFQLMGEKTAVNTTTTPEIESVESVIAKKALLHFKRTSTTTTVRFFKLLSRNIIDGVFEEVDEKATLQKIRGDMNRRMDSAKLWMNHAENGTAVIDSNDTNNSKDAKCPGPPAPSPELQQQQIQLENNDVCGVATKNESNNNDNDANNDSEKSFPHYRPKIDSILWRSVNSHSQVNHYHLKTSRMIYRATMEACFEMIGNKNDNTIDEEESMKSIISKRVLLHFKGETWGPLSRFTLPSWNNALMTATNTTKVRFFVPKSKHTVDLGTLTEVDEKTAMRIICDDIDRRMDTVYWPRAEVVAGESSFNSSNSTKQERMQPPEYTTNEKKRKSARFVTDKLPDVADMHVESLLDETNSDIGTGLFTNNHCNHTKQAPSPPEKKRKFTNAVKSIQSDFAKINVGEGMQHRRDEHVITMLSPMNHSDDTNQVTTQLHASTSNEMMSKYKAQSNMPLDVAEIDVDERLLDMRNADIVTGVSSTNNSNNVMQGTMHERKGKPRTDCSREQWLHADDDIAMSGFNDRSTPDAAKISVSLPQDQRQEFTQSPASATNEEMIKYTAESNNSVQTLPLDVAEINVDEGLLEKPKADVVTGVFPNNLSNNTIQGTMQPPTSATNEKKIKNTSESNNSVQLLPLDVAEIDAGLFEKPKEDVVTGLSPNNLSNDAMQGTMQPPSFAPNEKKRKRQTDCCRASKSLNDKHLDGSEINHVNNTAKQGTSRLPASAKNAKRRKNQQVNEEVNVFILSPDNIRKPLPTVQNVIIQHPSIPHPRNFILCFPSCTLSYTVPSYYDCLGYWGQKRREKAVLRTQQHYLDMYLKGLGICSSAKTRQHQTGSSNLPQRLSNAAKINVDTKERGDDEEEEPLINASSGAKITESVRPLPHPHHQQQQQQQQQKPNNENDDTNLLVSPYPRLGVDVILSLKDPVYTSIMYEFCQVMGERTNTEDKNIDTREMANKALLRFKNMNNIGGPHDEGSATMAATTLSSVRFFKRVKKGVYVEVDEIEALKKIRYDMYRRMESAELWNDAADESACSDVTGNYDSNDAKIPAPISQHQQQDKSQSVTSSEDEKNMKLKADFDRGNDYGQQSLPILSDSNSTVTEFIVEEEHNDKTNADQVSGVSIESEVSKTLEIDKDNASQLLQSGVGDMAIPMDDAVGKSDRATNYINFTSEEDSALSVTDEVNFGPAFTRHERTLNSTDNITEEGAESSMIESVACTPTSSMPKVVICLGEYLIDTELNPSALQPLNDRILHAETLPDYFDPSIRPSAPTNRRQIYIPGNRVFARWLNIDDPGSYGAWYPGLITGSRLSPSQTQLTFTESPQLLYHVRFDDGVESYDLDTEDIMLFDQYQEWLKVLEQYYSLPVSERNQLPRLSKHTRVFAKWIDQTDPELYGSWMAGKIVNSKVWKDRNERRIRYHILFDNGDEDTKINDVDVVPEELYQSLLVEKVNRGRMKMNQSGLSGFDLIVEASKLSPVKTCTVRGSIDESDNESEDEDAFMAEFRCLEVLEQAVPVTPSKVLRLTRTQSPDVHYGVRMKFKPWIVEHITHNALQTVPSETSPP